MFSEALIRDAGGILDVCRRKGLKLATAESCTGGLISSLFTEIAGSSAVFERGFVTYSNAAKTEMLGVDKSLIEKQGAVSEQVAVAMAQAAKNKAKVDLAVAVTGVAGPSGGTKEKPVGMVCIAVQAGDKTIVETFQFKGNRDAIRQSSVSKALALMKEGLKASFVSVA